ncbi:MAG: biopolymer transporter ExbD [Gemmatimonadales bacterium]|nr:MAG: biopolymer transporter ExbD [Gemmatimonadales bacterium]
MTGGGGGEAGPSRRRGRREASDRRTGAGGDALRSAVPTPAGLREMGVTSEINMTPMIDVMMALLIIFMVVTPVLTSYAADLPRASHVVPEVEEDVVQMGIDARGRFWVQDRMVPDEELVAHLARIYATRPGDHLLYLRADRRVPYDRVLDVVAAAREAGVRRIGAITEPVPTARGELRP